MGLDDGFSGDGGFPSSAAAPPVGGLGNYKGVMLCNRPAEDARQHGGGVGDSKPPFKANISAQYRDQLGLQPCKQAEGEGPVMEVKSRGPSAALRRHVRWVKDLQEQVRDDQRRVEEDETRRAAKKDMMQDVFKKQRDTIRQIRKDKPDGISREELMSVMEQYPPTGSKVKAKKPLWAMSEQEKDVYDEEEAANLISFAENLDFDKFVGDHEFRKALNIVNDRAKKIQKEQDVFKDSILKEFNEADDATVDEDEVGSMLGDGIDGASVFGSELGSQAGGGGARRRRRSDEASNADGSRAEWDRSTACGDERGRGGDGDASQAASELLQMNPQLRAVHSKGSVEKLIEKARSQGGSVAASVMG